jgi:hypothetical protein
MTGSVRSRNRLSAQALHAAPEYVDAMFKGRPFDLIKEIKHCGTPDQSRVCRKAPYTYALKQRAARWRADLSPLAILRAALESDGSTSPVISVVRLFHLSERNVLQHPADLARSADGNGTGLVELG